MVTTHHRAATRFEQNLGGRRRLVPHGLIRRERIFFRSRVEWSCDYSEQAPQANGPNRHEATPNPSRVETDCHYHVDHD